LLNLLHKKGLKVTAVKYRDSSVKDTLLELVQEYYANEIRGLTR
jgi:hypothetical protein